MLESDAKTWWSRPCGPRDVLAIAVPLVISTGAWTIQLFVDRMFLFWYSPEAMSATMPAGTLYWTAIAFPVGVAGYVNAFVAQYHGADRPERVGLVTWQGIWLGVLATPVFLALIPFAPWLFRWAGHPESLIGYESRYFETLMFAAGGVVIAASQAAFFTGRGETRTVMLSDVVATVVNIVFDYLWVFGKGGFPEMGITGAAWATVLSQWCKVAMLAWLMFRRPTSDMFHVWTTRRLDVPLLKRLLYYGGPSGLEYFVEGGAFAILTLFMGRMGETAMTASTLALNVNMVAFVPMVGVSIAAGTLMGQQLMQQRPDLAARATWTSLGLAMIYTLFFGFLYVAVPDLFLMGHSAGIPAEEFAEVRDLTVVLLRFVAAYCLLDAANFVLSGAIKGAGDTWFVLLVTVVSSLAGVAACVWGESWGVLWWWLVVTGWLWVRGVIVFGRFLQGRWRQMRVIEPDLAHEQGGGI